MLIFFFKYTLSFSGISKFQQNGMVHVGGWGGDADNTSMFYADKQMLQQWQQYTNTYTHTPTQARIK